MFLSDTFMTVIVILLSVSVGFYFWGVHKEVFSGFFNSEPDYDERAAELLNSYREQKEKRPELDVEQELSDS